MNNTVKIHIDGKAVEAPAGSTILDIARQEGIYIPTLCHSPLLRPLENCRLCVVKIAGEKKYKAACSTPVSEGMDITTQGDDLQQTRKFLLELLLDTHYGDCVAPCSVRCPANVDIQGYLAHIRHGEYREAVRLIKEKIPMPATIGRVCPHPCETVCRRHLVDEPIGINLCKRFAADFEYKSGERIHPDLPAPSEHRVAIVGGGPAGLSAAYYLRTLGHVSTIFEAQSKLGGMLRYGIPEYRLPKKLLDWEIDGILSLGIGVKAGVRWGQDFTLDDLKKEGYDAIFIAVGAWAVRKLGIVGEDLQGVVPGVDFLAQIAAGGMHRSMTVGKRVAIIGGGNVAIDAARSSLRLGAEEVTILYRRSRNEMPASHEEIEAAQKEGVNIQFLVAPTQLYGNNGSINQVQFIRMELGEPDAGGRRRPVPIEGSEVTMEVDQVISAIGQYPEIPLPENDGFVAKLPLTRWSTLGGDPRSMHTGQEMIFIGGDVFRGPDTVVAALADGRKAAYSLDRYFRAGMVQPEPLHFNISKGDLESIDREPFSVLRTASRESMAELETQKRINNFLEVELGLTEEQAQREAGRCLVCGCSAAFDCRLRELMNEFQVDWRDQPSKKIHYQRVAAVDTHPNIALDPNKCIRCERCYVACAEFQVSSAIDFKDWPRFNERCVDCGLCVDLCPTGALMEKREGRPVERLDWRTEATHCIHCGCGCQLNLKLKGEKQVFISDASRVPPNWSSTCRLGRFRIYDSLWFGERVVQPMIRQKTRLKEVSWPKAIKSLLEGFRSVQERFGSKALGALASPRATNESHYLLQKWLRAGWQSNGLDFPGRESREKLWSLMQQYSDRQGVSNELAGLEKAKAIFICGDEIETAAPVVATTIRRAARNRNISVWQLASRPDDLTAAASIALHAAPREWQTIVQALGRVAGAKGKSSAKKEGEFNPAEHGIGHEPWENLVKAFADSSSVAIVFSEDLLSSEQTAGVVESLFQLAQASGHLAGANGAGMYPVTSEINSTGALLMGITPNMLPGFSAVSSAQDRSRFMSAGQVSELPGEPWPALETALERREIKALLVQDAALLWKKNPERWRHLLSDLECLVMLESVPSPATDLAHVVLPVAAYGEQDGTVINLERRLLRLQKVFPQEGKSLADWDILKQIMATQGISFPRDMAAIHQEISALVPHLRGFDWSENSEKPIVALKA
ncbi:MAG: FAD-dependent oxidoreductase [Desulforhabdus sp.]|jgi:formate dehydrogenase major subunit|nr:FAD-dependent oxidoreductase [Desulforhabdus sp.]